MAWRIKVGPREAERMEVTLNGRSAFAWDSTMGHVEWPFPDWCRDLNDVQMVCTPYPNGKNISIAVFWDDNLVYEKRFDDVDIRKLTH